MNTSHAGGVPAGMPPIPGVPVYDLDGNDINTGNYNPAEHMIHMTLNEEDPYAGERTDPEPTPAELEPDAGDAG